MFWIDLLLFTLLYFSTSFSFHLFLFSSECMVCSLPLCEQISTSNQGLLVFECGECPLGGREREREGHYSRGEVWRRNYSKSLENPLLKLYFVFFCFVFSSFFFFLFSFSFFFSFFFFLFPFLLFFSFLSFLFFFLFSFFFCLFFSFLFYSFLFFSFLSSLIFFFKGYEIETSSLWSCINNSFILSLSRDPVDRAEYDWHPRQMSYSLLTY